VCFVRYLVVVVVVGGGGGGVVVREENKEEGERRHFFLCGECECVELGTEPNRRTIVAL
jgi:hypothetical protein